MAGKILASTVHVYDDEKGLVVLNAGDSVPAKYTKQVTNAKAFEASDDGEDVNADTTVDPGSAPAAGQAGAPPKK